MVEASTRDHTTQFIWVVRKTGLGRLGYKDEWRNINALTDRLAAHDEYRDAVGCYLGELLVRNFGGEWVPGHALGPAVRVKTGKGAKHVFPLGWVYRRADGGEKESIAGKLHRELGVPDPAAALGTFTDSGERA